MKRVLLGLSLTALAACAQRTDADSSASDIVGAVPAADYPEAATIDFVKNGQGYICSGTIIAPQVVLTAGHCVVGGATAFLVHAGNNVTLSVTASAMDYTETAESVNFTQHDVALVFLADPITLPRYPAIASSPVAAGTTLMNVGRIQNGVQTANLFEAGTAVDLPPEAPFDYRSTRVIQPGDSGGPDFIAGTHIIASVNSGAQDLTNIQYLARVDLVHDWIEEQIALHGGGGGPPTAGIIPNDTLTAIDRYDIVTSELNCRSGAGTASPITAQLFAGQTIDAAPANAGPRIQLAPDGSPWVMLQPPGVVACYVSARYEFIQPNPDQAPPGNRMPGTTNLVVTPGLYQSLALAVHGSAVTGSVRDSGCEFTISGSLAGQNPIPITVTTGTSSGSGTLNVIDATHIGLTAPNIPAACVAIIPQAEDGTSMPFGQAISPVVFAFRTVKSAKALFHDGPGSPSNGKFVENGQTVQQLSENQGGYVQVRFSDGTGPLTTGWLAETDLMAPQVPNTTL